MASRLELHEELYGLLGMKNVYFQPPESVRMKYPAIVYQRDGNSVNRADDKVYTVKNRYSGVVIDPDPDSEIPDLLLNHFEMCSLERGYPSDNLNHFPFTLYY